MNFLDLMAYLMRDRPFLAWILAVAIGIALAQVLIWVVG